MFIQNQSPTWKNGIDIHMAGSSGYISGIVVYSLDILIGQLVAAKCQMATLPRQRRKQTNPTLVNLVILIKRNIQKMLKPNYLKKPSSSSSLYRPFVQNDNRVLNRLVSCLKCIKLAEYSRPVWTCIITLGKQNWWQRTLLLKINWL